MTNRQLLVAGVIGALAIAAPAAAETKSWAALKNKLPADAVGVVAIDVKTMRAMGTFKDVMAALRAERQLREPTQFIDAVKATCGIDVIASISDVTLAITPRDRNMVVAIGLDGVDEAKLLDCANKVIGAKATGAKVTSKTVGAQREYTILAGRSTDQVYAAWPSKDVIVIGGRPDKPTGLDGYAGGKAATGDLAKLIGKAAVVAAPLGWGAGVNSENGMVGLFGTLTLTKGVLTLSGRLVTSDPAAQKKLHDEAKKDWQRSVDRAPSDLQKAMKALKLGSSGNDITVEASIPEADLVKTLMAFIKVF